MKITVEGVAHALKSLRRYEDADKKIMEVAYRLCEIGVPVAQNVFGSHATVTPSRTDHGARIDIDGEEVLFIEFGTGDAAGIHAKEYDAVPAVVRPGSWSETHAHMYEHLGMWYWHGKWMTETPPHPGAYDAYQAMVEALPDVYREVFR